jgi:hypothetical protein
MILYVIMLFQFYHGPQKWFWIYIKARKNCFKLNLGPMRVFELNFFPFVEKIGHPCFKNIFTDQHTFDY